ncbi:MAG TPA: ATP-binding SpoIIE family protein phosphatase [Bryobacteraceae bacterium]|nr:ATP-binding SpoIIE family protein phosphatase [Bryobacteraceae bacterium]
MESVGKPRQPSVTAVTDSSQVYEVRRQALKLAAEQNWDETSAGKLAIVVTEAATNLMKHARQGEILIGVCQQDGRDGVEVLAFDRGPGIENIEACLKDGYSNAGTSGAGLGAIARLADEFDIYSQSGKGTTLVARLYPPKSGQTGSNGASALQTSALQIGAVQVPVRGERECGDSWGWRTAGDGMVVMIADGLGHGPDAAEASRTAVSALASAKDLAPAALLERAHRALQHTRGAAIAIAAIDQKANQVQFAGVGNISAVILQPTATQHLVSHNGTAGHNVRKIQEFSYGWSPSAALVMHSDGITTHWRMNTYPGLARHHPALLAATLLRDESRGRDDACVVVVRNAK